MIKKTINFKTFFLFFIIFLTFLRIDYRQNSPENYNAGDDANYYFHNKTISYDFDLNYENQTNTEVAMYFNKSKGSYVPVHPIGSSFISVLFMFIGRIIENTLNISNFHYFLYSLSSIFYLFFSFKLLNMILNYHQDLFSLRKFFNIIIFFGSGVLYYAFERFGLTHVYEIFSISVLLFITHKYIISTRFHNFLSFLIGFFSIFLLSIRYVNYFLPLTPYFLFLILRKNNILKILTREWTYYLGLILGLLSILYLSYTLYGTPTINTGKIYDPSGAILSNFINNNIVGSNFFEFFAFIVKSFYTIFFSLEFGLLFSSPIIFFSLFSIYNLVKDKHFALTTVLLIIFSIPFFIVILWQTTASSFGYRYLFVLLPYAYLLVNKYLRNRFYEITIFSLSIFSIFLYLFFETTQMTSLSENINTFGVLHKYSAPNYVIEAFKASLIINSYLHIVFTSFMGVVIIKVFIMLFNYELILELLDQYGYLNSDVEGLLIYTSSLTIVHFLFIFFLGITCFNFLKK